MADSALRLLADEQVERLHAGVDRPRTLGWQRLSLSIHVQRRLAAGVAQPRAGLVAGHLCWVVFGHWVRGRARLVAQLDVVERRTYKHRVRGHPDRHSGRLHLGRGSSEGCQGAAVTAEVFGVVALVEDGPFVVKLHMQRVRVSQRRIVGQQRSPRHLARRAAGLLPPAVSSTRRCCAPYNCKPWRFTCTNSQPSAAPVRRSWGQRAGRAPPM